MFTQIIESYLNQCIITIVNRITVNISEQNDFKGGRSIDFIFSNLYQMYSIIQTAIHASTVALEVMQSFTYITLGIPCPYLMNNIIGRR